MKFRSISIEANYGWPGGNRSGVIEVPEEEIDDIEEYVHDWVLDNITWNWSDITKENE